MGCGKNDHTGEKEHHEGCICEVVRVIKRIQDIGADNDCVECKTDCFMAPLGTLVSPARNQINTRVFMLLDKNGDPFKAMFRPESHIGPATNCFSVFFRVQNVFDGCCATLQVLAPLGANGQTIDIIAHNMVALERLCDVVMWGPTDSCITVDLKCFCGIQCIDDVFIDFCEA